MTDDRTDQDAAATPGAPEAAGDDGTDAPPTAARPVRDEAEGPEEKPGEPEESDTGAKARRERPRPSTEGVGDRLPEGLADLAAAVRAIERGEQPPAGEPRGGGRQGRGAPARGRHRGSDPVPGAGAPSGLPAPAPGGEERPVARAPTTEGAPRRGGAPAAPVATPPHPAGTPAYGADAVAAARAALTAGGAPESLAEATVAALGERAGEELRDDPWQVLAVAGVRPDQADGFAKTLLAGAARPDDERRLRALVVWLLERAAERGHTALEATALHAALSRQSVTDPEQALRTAVSDGRVLVFHDAEERPGTVPATTGEDDEAPVRLLVALDRFALAEESLADGLNRLRNTFAADSAGDNAGWEAAAAAAPSPSAAELIRTAAGNGLVAHTGGESARAEPAALVAAARSLGLRAYAAAFTEDGRTRLARVLDEAGVTVDGLLSGHEGPGRDEEGALALDLLVVLDAPRLDVELAATLVESVPDGARLVLSGDPGVLWSDGPGRVFADLLAVRTCPQVASRTPDRGPIGELVSGIAIGELERVEAPEKEIVIVPVRDAGEAVHRTVQLVVESIPRAFEVPAGQTRVITPGHGGAAGTRALNAALKERLNPGPGRFAGFDPGDLVVYVPAPGRVVPGQLLSADAAGLHLDCGGAPVVVPRERVGATVRHGWAVTAHQAAGRRWPTVVVVLPGDATDSLTRAWVYTAFGRADRHLSVVQGVAQALPQAVAEVPARERTTRLRAVLREQAGSDA